MSGWRVFLRYWLPALLWAALIFTASGDAQSAARSSRIIGPLVRWLFPQLPAATVEDVVFVVRKAAHVAEYAVFAWLVWRVRRRPVRNDARPWRWGDALVAWGVVIVYAISDELHQAFVPPRQASPWDVLLDAAGGAVGLVLLWALHRWRARRAGAAAAAAVQSGCSSLRS
ncbi:MAG: VanZ family protein [Verrucomicrobiae bacterium]|nr:VanZ family protein [Verrucomicrobiae bacterium]MDW8310166.1 VanZ family protein [Verrucomicrobiales bacterium]